MQFNTTSRTRVLLEFTLNIFSDLCRAVQGNANIGLNKLEFKVDTTRTDPMSGRSEKIDLKLTSRELRIQGKRLVQMAKEIGLEASVKPNTEQLTIVLKIKGVN